MSFQVQQPFKFHLSNYFKNWMIHNKKTKHQSSYKLNITIRHILQNCIRKKIKKKKRSDKYFETFLQLKPFHQFQLNQAYKLKSANLMSYHAMSIAFNCYYWQGKRFNHSATWLEHASSQSRAQNKRSWNKVCKEEKGQLRIAALCRFWCLLHGTCKWKSLTGCKFGPTLPVCTMWLSA